jgi:hypothetical protein
MNAKLKEAIEKADRLASLTNCKYVVLLFEDGGPPQVASVKIWRELWQDRIPYYQTK